MVNVEVYGDLKNGYVEFTLWHERLSDLVVYMRVPRCPLQIIWYVWNTTEAVNGTITIKRDIFGTDPCVEDALSHVPMGYFYLWREWEIIFYDGKAGCEGRLESVKLEFDVATKVVSGDTENDYTFVQSYYNKWGVKVTNIPSGAYLINWPGGPYRYLVNGEDITEKVISENYVSRILSFQSYLNLVEILGISEPITGTLTITKYCTDPFWYDTDRDYLPDYLECVVYHSDPLAIDSDNDGFRDSVECLGFNTNPWKIDGDRDNDGMPDAYEKYCKQQGGWQDPDVATPRYAILFAARKSINAPSNNEYEFWMDLVIMHEILINVYNYKDDEEGGSSGQVGFNPATDQIAFLYRDGYGESFGPYSLPQGVVDGCAKKSYLETVVNILKGYLNNNGFLFVLTFDHSGDSSEQEYPLFSLLTQGGSAIELGDIISDFEFATIMNQLTVKKRVFVMQQCYSGGFVDDLSSSNTVILTDSSYMQIAWGGHPEKVYYHTSIYSLYHGEMLYHFFSALRRYFVQYVVEFGSDGIITSNSCKFFLNVDRDGNNLISFKEVYSSIVDWLTDEEIYSYDSHHQGDNPYIQPQLDADGNGISQQGRKNMGGDWDDDKCVEAFYF